MISESRYRIAALATMGVVLLGSAPADAQSWANGRPTPALRELIAIDATGEPAWLFGAEDIAGDGLGTFGDEEREIDLRSAYAAVLGRRLWLRVYVAGDSVPARLRVHVFIDADRNPETGGSRRAPEIDDELALEASEGGYEVVLLLAGAADEEALGGAFRWAEEAGEFEPIADLAAADGVSESGTDRDPLIGQSDVRGYRQARVGLGALGLDDACDARLTFRGSDGEGLIDAELGAIAACVPGDDNENGVSDVAETDDRCEEDAQCPGGGACTNGQCIAPEFVVGDGEVAQGGALTCTASRKSHAAHWPLLVGAGAAAAAWARRSPRTRRRSRRP